MPNRHRIVASAFALALAGASCAAVPATPSPEWSAHLFVDLFNRVCVKNVGRPDLFLKELKLRKAVEMAPELAKAYLHAPRARAWTITNVVGDFVIANRSENVCSVHGKKLSPELVEADFAQLAGTAPSGTMAKNLSAQRSGDKSVHMQTYVWAMDGAPQKTIFTLTTTTDPEAPLHAIASVALFE